MDIQKKCSVCGIMKSYDEYYKSQRGTRCKLCTLETTRQYKRDKRRDLNFKKIESLKQIERRIKLWENTLIHTSKRRGVEHNITVGDIKKMYENQLGLCYWFKIPMVPSNKNKHPQQPSIDRLDRNRGYTIDNVVLCTYAANIGRNETDLETWTEFLKVMKL